MVRVGILTCHNTREDACCCSHGCLDAARKNGGMFARYADRGGAEIVGIATCASCPTNIAPEKVLRKVEPLVLLGVEAIHLSDCMMTLCPFRNKYAKLLRERYPAIEIVEKTHDADEPTRDAFVGMMRPALAEAPSPMAGLIKQMLAMMVQQQAPPR